MKGAAEEDRRRFKQPVNYKHAQKSRSMSTLQIRKAKKDERMDKARGRPPDSLSLQQRQPSSLSSRFSGGDPTTVINHCMGTLKHWWIPGQSPVPPAAQQPTKIVLEAMEALQRILVATKNPPIQEILNAGALPYMVHFLNYDNLTHLQSLAMSALTTMCAALMTMAASSTCHAQQQLFQEPGVVDQCVRLLMSPVDTTREQCAWLLANFAQGGSIENRNVVLNSPDFRVGVLDILQSPTTSALLMQDLMRLLRNLTSLRPIPRRDQVDFVLAPLVPVLVKNPMFIRDPSLLAHTLWLFANLSHEIDSSEGRIDVVMASATPKMLNGIIDFVLHHGRKDPCILIPALRTLGNYVSSETEEQCQAVINANILDHALELMQHPSVPVRKELCFMLSNVCAGTHDQIVVVFHRHLDEPLLHMAMSAPWEIRKEAIWAIRNICFYGSNLMRSSIVAKGALEALSRILSTTACDKEMIIGILDAFEKLLEYNQDRIPYLLDLAGGIDKLEVLQEHPDYDVYEKSKAIIEKYFGDNNDDDMGEENQDPSAFLNEDGNFTLKTAPPPAQHQLFGHHNN